MSESNVTQTQRKPLFLLANNGEIVCKDHLLHYGIRNGRDSSGRRMEKVSEADRAYLRNATGREVDCEFCRYEGR
jgi:hypothetical protein